MPSPQDRSRAPRRIAIVGGGPGGLLTAWHIERHAASPLDLTIFEATGRLGGKILSPRFSKAPVPYEAGAAELYGYDTVGNDPLRDLVEELGLATRPLTGSAVCVGDRVIGNVDDVGRMLGEDARERLLAFDDWARSTMTTREYYESGSDHATAAVPTGLFDAALHAIGFATVRRYIETMIHSDMATEPSATTVGYGLQNYLMNDPATMRLYRIVGGNERLVAALAGRLTASVRLHSAVTEVASQPGGQVTLTWHSEERPQRECFDAVVLAMPIAPLATMTFVGDDLADAMQRHIAHHDHPAHYLRITFLLNGRVPAVPGEDDYIMVDAFGGSCLYIETSRDPVTDHGVLGWLVGGDAAESMAAMPDDAIVAAALAALPSFLAPCRGRVLEARVHRWVGAVSAVPGGWHPLPVATRHRPSARHPALFVVGDYLYDSTLNGVFDSAEYVAGWLTAARETPADRAGEVPEGKTA